MVVVPLDEVLEGSICWGSGLPGGTLVRSHVLEKSGVGGRVAVANRGRPLFRRPPLLNSLKTFVYTSWISYPAALSGSPGPSPD